MSQVNPNINNLYLQQGYQNQPKSPQQVRLPAYYNVADSYDRLSFKDALKDNIAYEMLLKPFIEHPMATLGTWLALGVGIDAYSHANSGNYEGTLLQKAASFGDRIENSKAIQSKPVQTVIHGINSVGEKGKKLASKSAILRAMKETPTMPEWQMVKTQMFNQKQEVVTDFIKIADALKLNSNGAIKLKDIGLSGYEKTMLKEAFNVQKVSQISENEAVTQVLLNRLGKSSDEIKNIQKLGANAHGAIKGEILKEMGLTAEKVALIKDDVYGKYINDVKVATGKVGSRVRIGAGHYKWMGPATKLFERTIGCDEVHNKLHSMEGGAKTATGRFTAKATQMLHRGVTWNNGKLGALCFIAPILVELGMNVAKADKDQKVGTAANGFVENVSWIFTFPLALRWMHSFGGIKLAGMGKDKVEQYRKLVDDFNKKVSTTVVQDGVKVPNPNTFKTKAEYDIARREVEKQLKELKNVKGQNIFTRGLRKVVGWMTPDLCRLNSYRNSNPIANTMRKTPAFLRNLVGVPARFCIWGLLSMSVLGGALTKCTTAIFGKSYDSMKQDEREDARKQQERFLKDDLKERLYNAQLAKQGVGQGGVNNGIVAEQKVNNIAMHGLKPVAKPEDAAKEKVDNYTYIPSQENVIPHPIKNRGIDNYTYIPSSECTIKSDKVNENNRKYIPSQMAANIQKNFDNSGLASALDRAQRAEDKALRVLAGNFDGV